MSSKDDFGDRMKSYEKISTAVKLNRNQPLIVRLDGRAFHTFTKGLTKPVDYRLSIIMNTVCDALLKEFHPTLVYMQSDEITLAWDVPTSELSQYPFDGKRHKIESVIPSYACSVFTRKQIELLPEKKIDISIDARAFNVPTELEAYNAILWRQLDASKNYISSLAQTLFSSRQLNKLSTRDRAKLILDTTGKDVDTVDERLGLFFFRGEELHNPQQGELFDDYKSLPVMRSKTFVKHINLLKLRKDANFKLCDLPNMIEGE